MKEPVRAAMLIAGRDQGPSFSHIAPHLSRVAEVFQQAKGWESVQWAIVFELVVREDAIRLDHSWFYDPSGHKWVRDSLNEQGERISYHFERKAGEKFSKDWYTFDKKGQELA